MAAKHGSKAKFHVQDSGDTLRDLSDYLTDAGLARTADTAEVSTLGDTHKAYIAGLIDGTVPLSGIIDPTVDGYLNGILALEGQGFQYDPQGGGTGLPRYTGSGILTSYEQSTGMGGAGTFTAQFQISGDVTRELQA